MRNSILRRVSRILGGALAIALVATLVPQGLASAKPKPPAPQRKIKNVIVMISDGMVTGDHETGFLTGPGSGQLAGDPAWTPLVNNGKGAVPGMQFNSGDHTNSLIPFFAKGAGVEKLRATATGIDPMRGAYVDNTGSAKTIIARMK